MKKINFGCGNKKLDGWVNVDWNPGFNPNVAHDLNKFPYPFEDNSADEIRMIHTLEHLDRPFDAMRELHRILKPGGKLLIKLPHASRALTHPEHCHGFDISFPLFFNQDNVTLSGYYGFAFDLELMELHWQADDQESLRRLGYGKIIRTGVDILNFIFSFLANLSQPLCSRLWSYWVGGFEEIELRFICRK